MKSLSDKLDLLSSHLRILDKTFRKKANYTSSDDYLLYRENLVRFEELVKKEKLKSSKLKMKKSDKGVPVSLSFADEIYGPSDRQMKLADALEYLLLSRGVYYLFQSNRFQKDRVSKFIELNLRFVNLLMMYETLTVDSKLRRAFLNNLHPLIKDEIGNKELRKWKDFVGFPVNDKKRYRGNAPNLYFDSLLPKTAGGLWHEILVYCFVLKYNIGYIFPLLLSQKPISLIHKLSPPDLIILHHKTFRYYGIEIGNLKERQSGGFMAPSGIPVIPVDTRNARISDRCPLCGKWIEICPKVIAEFSDIGSNVDKPMNEIRCLTDCKLFTLQQKLNGKCKYMKFRQEKDKSGEFEFADGNHYHYHCCLSKRPNLKDRIVNSKAYADLKQIDKYLRNDRVIDEKRRSLIQSTRKKYPFIKTHSVFYQELVSLHKINQGRYTEVEAVDKED